MVCMTCKKFFRPEKNGVVVEEMMPRQTGPGEQEWVPYKLWMADEYRCPGCGQEAIGGFSLSGPVSEHYRADYKDIKQALEQTYGPAVQVMDCGPTHLGWRPDNHLNVLRVFVSKGGILADKLADMEGELRDLRDAAEKLVKTPVEPT